MLVSRSEVDLKKIVEEYRAMYDISLQENIQVKSRTYNMKYPNVPEWSPLCSVFHSFSKETINNIVSEYFS